MLTPALSQLAHTYALLYCTLPTCMNHACPFSFPSSRHPRPFSCSMKSGHLHDQSLPPPLPLQQSCQAFNEKGPHVRAKGIQKKKKLKKKRGNLKKKGGIQKKKGKKEIENTGERELLKEENKSLKKRGGGFWPFEINTHPSTTSLRRNKKNQCSPFYSRCVDRPH